MLDNLFQDLRSGLRSLAGRPAITLLAIGVLAIGIGATTTIYTFVDNVLLRGLPYPAAERLVYFDDGNHSNPRFRIWRERTDSFEALGSVWVRSVDLLGDGDPARLTSARVSPEFFELFGATPTRGRLFEPADFEGATAAVLSYGAWTGRWGSDETVIGRTLRLGDEPAVVVGVLAEDFHIPEALVGARVDVWLPYGPGDPGWDFAGMYMLAVAGRLRSGVSIDTAQEELDVLAGRLSEEDPEQYRNDDGSVVRFPLQSFFEATVGGISRTLWLLLGAAGLMLALACANVANLLLARGTDRAREMALRLALGAGRARLVGQLLTESLLLALASGVVGTMLALAGVRALRTLMADLPRSALVSLDARVLLAAFGISAATGLIFGLFPALQTHRTSLGEPLREGARGATAGAEAQRTRSLLVVAEVGVAVLLAVGAGLILDSFARLTSVDPGFEPAQAYTLSVDLQRVDPESRAAFVAPLLERVGAIAGVEATGAAATVPFQITGGGRCCWFDRVFAEGEGGFGEESHPTIVTPVTAGYFEAIGARLVQGRFIGPDDDAETPAAVITTSAARSLFGHTDVVGRRVDIDHTFEIPVVGVIEDLHHWGITQRTDQDLFVPLAAYHEWTPSVGLVVRTSRRDAGLATEVREAVWSVAPELPVDEFVALDAMVADSFALTRTISVLLGGFALLALLVASAGIYGSLLYWVGRRSHELGIRLALGARPGELARLVVLQAARQIGAGLAIGLAVAVVASRTMEGLLYGVEGTDPRTYAMVAALLGAVALMAAWLPARRAAATDPADTLRGD